MRAIELLDESRYAEQMHSVALPALNACRTEFTVETAPGIGLRCLLFRPPEASRCAVLCHGFSESGDKLLELAYYFLCQGYAVLLPDHRGHGWSSRENRDPSTVYVHHFDDYVRDLSAVVEAARPRLPAGCPLVLFGHSMGGGIAARALEMTPDVYEKCVLNAPMLSVATGGVPTWLAKALAGSFVALGMGRLRFFVHQRYAPGERFEDSCCTSRARFDYYAQLRRNTPQLRTNAASYRWIWEALRSCDRLLQPESLARVHTPTLVLRAQLDTLVLPGGQDAFVRGVPCAHLEEIPGVKHEIYRSRNDQLLPYLTRIFSFLEI